jgi:hypothetical protein
MQVGVAVIEKNLIALLHLFQVKAGRIVPYPVPAGALIF